MAAAIRKALPHVSRETAELLAMEVLARVQKACEEGSAEPLFSEKWLRPSH